MTCEEVSPVPATKRRSLLQEQREQVGWCVEVFMLCVLRRTACRREAGAAAERVQLGQHHLAAGGAGGAGGCWGQKLGGVVSRIKGQAGALLG